MKNVLRDLVRAIETRKLIRSMIRDGSILPYIRLVDSAQSFDPSVATCSRVDTRIIILT